MPKRGASPPRAAGASGSSNQGGGEHVYLLVGCSGPYGIQYARGLLHVGAREVWLLARDVKAPDLVALTNEHETGGRLHLVRGSMFSAGDICAAAKDAIDSIDNKQGKGKFGAATLRVVLSTPMGNYDDAAVEIRAAKVLVDGLHETELLPTRLHVIYVSVMPTPSTVVCRTILCKQEVEKVIAASGIPYTALRTGSYMEDVFGRWWSLLARGFMPALALGEHTRLRFTAIPDVSGAMAALQSAVGGHVDVGTPDAYDLKALLNAVARARTDACEFSQANSNDDAVPPAPAAAPIPFPPWTLLAWIILVLARAITARVSGKGNTLVVLLLSLNQASEMRGDPAGSSAKYLHGFQPTALEKFLTDGFRKVNREKEQEKAKPKHTAGRGKKAD